VTAKKTTKKKVTKKAPAKKRDMKLNPEGKGGWQKGQSGNPKGRPPKAKCIPDLLKKIGEEEGTRDGESTKLEVVLRRVYSYALQGKPWAVQFIADRTEGKPKQSMETEVNFSGKMTVTDAMALVLDPEGKGADDSDE